MLSGLWRQARLGVVGWSINRPPDSLGPNPGPNSFVFVYLLTPQPVVPGCELDLAADSILTSVLKGDRGAMGGDASNSRPVGSDYWFQSWLRGFGC
ncbi:unnamed protein product [Penicillium roqueforti FM164]|uniref:Genomic scaffold, ProqFM164S01 n=1 Tax=Penicillium roqueforti (strain FM164) TaxID=1365484 RepID=W6PX27_PENRF|nr:unnamed protein product [Penicillium roqueforti FM164]